jgi:hypothetical protein
VAVFLPGQNPGGIQLAPNSTSAPYQLSTGGIAGAGIQVNFWYRCQEPDIPVGPANGNKPQNPDNSGGQFMFEADCSFKQQPAVFGQGIETYKIADVTSAMVNGVCVVTIKKTNTPDVLPRTAALRRAMGNARTSRQDSTHAPIRHRNKNVLGEPSFFDGLSVNFRRI